MIADRFTVSDDVTWFDTALISLVEEEFGEEKKPLVDCGVDAYFVDFLRDAPETTGKLLKKNLEFPKGTSEDEGFSLGMLNFCLVNFTEISLAHTRCSINVERVDKCMEFED